MAELSTLARPYAKAAFEYALGSDNLAGWSAQLKTAAAVAGNDRITGLLASPSLTGEQLAEQFIAVCGDQLDDKGGNFIRVLAENRRLKLLPQIAALFEEFKSNREKTVAVELTTAFELEPAIQEKLSAALGESLQRKVSLHSTVDKSLIGGVVIRAADVVIDASLRGRLAKLSASMNA